MRGLFVGVILLAWFAFTGCLAVLICRSVAISRISVISDKGLVMVSLRCASRRFRSAFAQALIHAESEAIRRRAGPLAPFAARPSGLSRIVNWHRESRSPLAGSPAEAVAGSPARGWPEHCR